MFEEPEVDKFTALLVTEASAESNFWNSPLVGLSLALRERLLQEFGAFISGGSSRPSDVWSVKLAMGSLNFATVCSSMTAIKLLCSC